MNTQEVLSSLSKKEGKPTIFYLRVQSFNVTKQENPTHKRARED